MASYRQIGFLLGFCVLLVAGLAYWAGLDNSANQLTLDENASPIESPFTPKELDVTKPKDTNVMNPIAVFETNKGTIEIELFKDTMPITAGNFEKLVREKYYDGIKFHRVIDGFMIQGGDPLTKDDSKMNMWGTGGPGYAIADEHIVGPLLTNTRGTLSMANSGPNSGGSQFFINLVDNVNLDFDKPPLSSAHPVFGRVVAGMDIVDVIGKVPVTPGNNRPVDPVIIKTATIKEGSN